MKRQPITMTLLKTLLAGMSLLICSLTHSLSLQLKNLELNEGSNPIQGWEVRLSGPQTIIFAFEVGEIVNGLYTYPLPQEFYGQTITIEVRPYDNLNTVDPTYFTIDGFQVPNGDIVAPTAIGAGADIIGAPLVCRDGFIPSSLTYQCVAN